MSNVIKSEARFHDVSSHHNGSSIICNNVIMNISLKIEVVVSGMYLNSTKTQYNYMTLSGIPSQYYTGWYHWRVDTVMLRLFYCLCCLGWSVLYF